MTFNLIKTVKHFSKDECGASMVEYGVALMIVVTIGTTAMSVLGGGVSAQVTSACATIGTPC